MATSDVTEFLELASHDENLKDCTSLEALHESKVLLIQICMTAFDRKLKQLSDDLTKSDAPDSPFAQIAFEGTHPNPVYTPNAFKANKAVDGQPITAYYRYAVKDEAVAARAIKLRSRTASASSIEEERRRTSEASRRSTSSYLDGVVGGSVSSLLERIRANDEELLGVDFSKQAVFQMKPDEKMKELCDALQNNTVVRTVIMKECGLGDSALAILGAFLSTNKTLVYVDLASNIIGEDGAIALAQGLSSNQTLEQLGLMNMLGLGKSERVLNAFIDMYQTNTTLKKIVWRLDHPLANTLARLMTRNNSIYRRIQQGKPFQDLLPEHLRAAAEAELTSTSE